MIIKEEVEELQGSVKKMEKELHEQTLALELLKEVKKSAIRWFVISIILLVALICSNVAWLVYESSFETVTETHTVEQNQEDTENSNMSGVIN